jgi:hypothetical protein
MVLIACMLQEFLQDPPPGHTVGMGALADPVETLSFSETRKRTTRARF